MSSGFDWRQQRTWEEDYQRQQQQTDYLRQQQQMASQQQHHLQPQMASTGDADMSSSEHWLRAMQEQVNRLRDLQLDLERQRALQEQADRLRDLQAEWTRQADLDRQRELRIEFERQREWDRQQDLEREWDRLRDLQRQMELPDYDERQREFGPGSPATLGTPPDDLDRPELRGHLDRLRQLQEEWDQHRGRERTISTPQPGEQLDRLRELQDEWDQRRGQERTSSTSLAGGRDPDAAANRLRDLQAERDRERPSRRRPGSRAERAGRWSQLLRPARKTGLPAPDPGPTIDRFIRDAEPLGLPVRLVREIRHRDYRIVGGAAWPRTIPLLDTLVLKDDQLRALATSDLLKIDAGSVGALYHEATHAWFDLNADNTHVRALAELSRIHYSGSPLEIGDKHVGFADDPKRIVQEAAAAYVTHRITAWLVARKQLEVLARDPEVRPEVIKDELAKVRSTYDERMSRRVFGYEDEGDQASTTKEIRDDLRLFLEEHLMEGRIRDRFEDDPQLRALAAEAAGRAQ
jgi:hypothetical protein